MTIYISTGGYSKVSADKTSEELISCGINDIELSGGTYSDDLVENLKKLKNKANFQVHNYFPPPKIPFVLNLASQDKDISQLSINHIYNAIDCCEKLESKYFSFHAGFLCDIKPNELGKKILKRKLYNRNKSIDLFLERIDLIAKKAKEKDIKIMIENNVFSQENKKEFEENPLLMCDSESCIEIINQTPENVQLLLDVAHLKVSANTLAFDPIEMLKDCKDYIGGYHLSENNGLSDTNEPFSDNAWFFDHLRPDLNYYSIEVYNQSVNKIKNLKNILANHINKKS